MSDLLQDLCTPLLDALEGWVRKSRARLRDRDAVRRRLEEADRIKDFVSSVTHELRSPLTSVLISLEYIRKDRDGHLTGDQLRFLRIIENNIGSLHRFIGDLLDLEKIERGRMEIKKVPTTLSAVIHESVTLMAGMAEQKDIQVVVPPPDADHPVFADPDRLRQVLINLLSNSFKFTPKSGRVEVRVEERADCWLTSVVDNGRGIPQEELRRIFDKYVQVRYFHRDAAELRSTGLGLAVAKLLVEAHDGEMWAESELGQGAAFHFKLPKVSSERPASC